MTTATATRSRRPASPTATRRPSVIAFMEDRRLFGDQFRAKSWDAWKTVLKAAYGLPLSKREEVTWFCAHTGRSMYTPPVGGYREVVVIVGRQSGKTRIAALIADYEASFPVKAPDVGEYYAVMVAQDTRNALRTLQSYATDPFRTSEILKASVVSDVADVLTLDTRVKLGVYPCVAKSVRGPRSVVSIADEVAFFLSTDGNPVDTEVLRAMRPGLAMTGGRLWVLSSPYGESGALWDLHSKHYGRDDSSTLVIQATAPELNPSLPADYLAKMREDDPEAASAEIDGEFRKGVATLLDPKALDDCVDHVCRERRPGDRGVTTYQAFADAATGGGKDSFTLAVAHVEKIGGRSMAVQDVIRAWAPPFNPESVIAEASELLKTFRINSVTGDRFAGAADGSGFVGNAFQANNIRYQVAERDRSALYLEFLALVNSGAVLLVNVPEMLKEFRGLVRKTGAGGRDRVDHRAGAHDDQANACAGVLVALTATSGRHFAPLVGSATQSTDGSVYIGRERVRGPHSDDMVQDAPWVHPHERGEPLRVEKDVIMGPHRAMRWRRAWTGGDGGGW